MTRYINRTYPTGEGPPEVIARLNEICAKSLLPTPEKEPRPFTWTGPPCAVVKDGRK